MSSSDQPVRAGVEERCPTCGCPVRVVTGGEGTSHYERLGGAGMEALNREGLGAAVEAYIATAGPVRRRLSAAIPAFLALLPEGLPDGVQLSEEESKATAWALGHWLDQYEGVSEHNEVLVASVRDKLLARLRVADG